MNKTEQTELYHKLMKLYVSYTEKTISSILYHTKPGTEEFIKVDYGIKGKLYNLSGLITDWVLVGKVASNVLSNSKKRKICKLVDNKHRKVAKKLMKKNNE